jgi:hypothetical protein
MIYIMNQEISFKKVNTGEMLLSILFIVYLIMGFNTPSEVATIIDALPGKIVVLLVILYLFMYHNPIVGILAILVAFDLFRRSSHADKTDDTQKTKKINRHAYQLPKSDSEFTQFNQFPFTLEQEMVSKMAPAVNSGKPNNKASYQPTLDNLHDASTLI